MTHFLLVFEDGTVAVLSALWKLANRAVADDGFSPRDGPSGGSSSSDTTAIELIFTANVSMDHQQVEKVPNLVGREATADDSLAAGSPHRHASGTNSTTTAAARRGKQFAARSENPHVFNRRIIAVVSSNDAVAFLCSPTTGTGYFISLIAPRGIAMTNTAVLVVAASLPHSVFLHQAVWDNASGGVILLSEMPQDDALLGTKQHVSSTTSTKGCHDPKPAWAMHLLRPDLAASGFLPILCNPVYGLAPRLAVKDAAFDLSDVLLRDRRVNSAETQHLVDKKEGRQRVLRMPLFLGTPLTQLSGDRIDLLVPSGRGQGDASTSAVTRVYVPRAPEMRSCCSSPAGLALNLLACGLSQWSKSSPSNRLEAAWAEAVTSVRVSLIAQADGGEVNDGLNGEVEQPELLLRVWIEAYALLLQAAPQYLSSPACLESREHDVSHLRCLIRELVRLGRASLLVDVLCPIALASRSSASAIRRLLEPLCDEAYCLVNRMPSLGDRMLACCSDEFRSFITSAFTIIQAAAGDGGGAKGSATASPRSYDEVSALLSGSAHSVAEGMQRLTLEDVRLYAVRVLMRSGPVAAQKCLEPCIRTAGCAKEIEAIYQQYQVLASHIAMSAP